MKPFRRGRFAELPAKPRRAHPYFESRGVDVRVTLPPGPESFGDVKIHYREMGASQAPPLLLVHGLMTTSYSWRYLMEPLGRDYRVIALDLPGAGHSDKPKARYSGAALAQLLVEFSRAIGIRGCAVVGNSMGGYLCMRAALADPGAFERVVNIHSPGPPDARHHALHLALSLPPLRRLLAWWVRRAPLPWAHRNVHYYDESLKSLEEAHEYGDPLGTADGVEAFVRFLWHTFDPAELRQFMKTLGAEKFPVPLQLIYSREDPLVPPAVGQVLHDLVPEAPLVWLEQTSHFAHVDTPEKVLPPLLEFLKA